MTVLFAHSVAVLGLPPEREFFFNRLGFSLGEMGLDMLFVTSGFPVTASLLGRRRILIACLWARISAGVSRFKCGSPRPHQMTGSCLSETLSTISWAAATPTL